MDPNKTSKLTSYLVSAGALGMAATPTQSDAAVIFTNFDPDLTASGRETGLNFLFGVRLWADPVHGVVATSAPTDSPVPPGTFITLSPGGYDPGGKSAPRMPVDGQLTGYENTFLAANILAIGSIVDETSSFITTGLGPGLPFPSARDAQVGRHYQGFRYDLEGNSYYGWFLYEYQEAADPLDNSITLMAAAIQSTPGQGITVPEPSSLGLLALGAAGMAGRRRRPKSE